MISKGLHGNLEDDTSSIIENQTNLPVSDVRL